MRISVICTVTLGVLVSANEIDDRTGRSISEARQKTTLMHLQTTTSTPKQMLRSSNSCRVQQAIDWTRGASLAQHVQKSGAKSPQTYNDLSTDVVEKQAQRFASLSTTLVSIQCWVISTFKLTDDLSRRILKPDCAIWRG